MQHMMELQQKQIAVHRGVEERAEAQRRKGCASCNRRHG
jgi:transcriptional regulator NrdR family protein